MSKLSHSNQPTMDEIDYQRAIENGDEDLIPRRIKLKKWQEKYFPWHGWSGFSAPGDFGPVYAASVALLVGTVVIAYFQGQDLFWPVQVFTFSVCGLILWCIVAVKIEDKWGITLPPLKMK